MIKIRKLQRQNENQEWIDDTYACNDETGGVVFCYNSTWGRMGSFYNLQLQKSNTPIDEIETIICPTRGWRWLPTEVVDDQQASTYLNELDEACATSRYPLVLSDPPGQQPESQN